MDNEIKNSTQRTINEFDYYTLQKRVSRAGNASLVVGLIQLLIGIAILFIFGSDLSMEDGGNIAFMMLFFIPIVLIGAVFMILGARIRKIYDINTNRYFWILLIITFMSLLIGMLLGSISGELGGTSIAILAMLYFLISGINSWRKLQIVSEFRNKLHYPNYAFTGAWWAVLIVPSIMILVFSLLIMGNS